MRKCFLRSSRRHRPEERDLGVGLAGGRPLPHWSECAPYQPDPFLSCWIPSPWGQGQVSRLALSAHRVPGAVRTGEGRKGADTHTSVSQLSRPWRPPPPPPAESQKEVRLRPAIKEAARKDPGLLPSSPEVSACERSSQSPSPGAAGTGCAISHGLLQPGKEAADKGGTRVNLEKALLSY